MSFESVLKKHPLFKNLNETEFLHAVSFLKVSERRYRKGEHPIRMGEPFLFFGVVTEGAVQVYTDDIDGGHMMMANVGCGDSFGESLAYFATSESPVYVLAAEDTTIVWLSAAVLKENALAKNRESTAALLCERFTALLAERALSQNDRIQILSKATIRERLVTFFTQWEHRSKSRTFSIPFDRNSLAVYLGVNRSALSRELSKMKAEGSIDFFKNSFRLLS